MKNLLTFAAILSSAIPIHAQYYHAFQNYDDDVDRIKSFSNFFGGDQGILNGSSTPQIRITRDTSNTRSGFGRSLKIDYGPLKSWSTYVESFERQWFATETSLDLSDLFPDFAEIAFQGRHLDSLVFYCKLNADLPLTLSLELEDARKQKSKRRIEIHPSNEWQRIAVAFTEFLGSFDRRIAKFFGLTFENFPFNQDKRGTLYVDDFYLVENDFDKPSFLNDDELLKYLNKVSFRHFWMAVEPNSKFALDRHIWRDLISVDAIGFQLTSYVIAHKNNWIEPTKIETRVQSILYNLLHRCKHATDSAEVKVAPLAYATVNGIWAHFLDATSLARKDKNTEFSLFSNALLLSGVVVAKEYFNTNDSLVSMANTLLEMSDWNFLFIPEKQLMHYDWKPETSFSPYFSDWFSEELDLAFLLGFSAPFAGHRLPANPYLSDGYYKPYCTIWPTGNYIYSAPGANFTYYFLQMYGRFPIGLRASIPRFENARNALLADLEFCKREYAYLKYDLRIFGTTACEGPDSAGIAPSGKSISNYHAYGYPCRFDAVNLPNGTIAVYGSGAATLFIPEEAVACLKYYYNELDAAFINNYGYSFWSPIFGFPDAFHLSPDRCADPQINKLNFRGPWLSAPRFGIDLGPMIMNIDSYLAEKDGQISIRDLFSSDPNIREHLPQFDPITSVAERNLDSVTSFMLFSNYPNPFNPSTNISYNLPKSSHVRIVIYNTIGQHVRTLVNQIQHAGEKVTQWDGKNDQGQSVKSGIYIYRVEYANIKQSHKMLMLH